MANYKYKLSEADSGVLKPKDVDPALIKRLEDKYGPVDMVYDFFDKELKTYYKTDSVDKETGKISHDIIKLASFGDALQKMSQAVKALKQLMGTEDARNDQNIQAVAKDLKDVFNKYRTHLRKNYPDQYNQIKSALEEISTTAAGGEYSTPFAFNPNKKADGAAVNYYYKLGYKKAPKPKSTKTVDIVPLNEETQELESYINVLGVESSALKKHITDRILGFDKIENKLNELVPLLGDAKNKTMDYYKQTPDFKVVYPTDLAIDYIDDLIEMFKKEE
jgi:hypothetical protein